MTYTVVKRDADGEVTLTYDGEVIDRGEHYVVIEARFGFDDMDLGYVTLKKNDRFTEWFYDNRWYNVFRVHDRDSDELKGFYCNVTRPADIDDNQVAADDLELDVFVQPDGETLLLDKDEYDALELDAAERRAVQAAIREIKTRVAQREGPFEALAQD